MRIDPTCDCTCHPHNGMVSEQKQWRFPGTIVLAGKTEAVWCCWCHYLNEEGEAHAKNEENEV